ncbi:MAG: hypothetical protein RI563_09445 [Thiohalophilus sp.]|uniref:hypothetical protein n=1 Tax=Thiohalophilus sp. TaxID=3028392 RepID=UPI0028708FC4|nr:hypothetical protein [Thiohalophilus sp.]MDR9437096.1 hypothetical protein [Thiohalophilus sp.]
MIRLYSKRLLLPFIGVVQVAELGWGRALSLDGKNWAIRYAHNDNEQVRNGPFRDDPRVNFSLVVTIDGEQLETRAVHPSLEPERVRADSQRLFEAIRNVRIPFEPADCYEYWLLDGNDGSPLALLHACVDEAEMQLPVPPLEWLSMPAAELAIPDPDPPVQATYPLPVNYRLQKQIEERAGNQPRAAWFERSAVTEGFPACLIRDEWADPECQRLCDLYLQRIAPRLLMMAGLPRTVRQQLEQAACEHVFEVERFYPLYPEVVDDSLLNTARVEARLRRANDV